CGAPRPAPRVRGRAGAALSGGYFFFQAEDGIRGGHVTGVQTCALPICALFCREFTSCNRSTFGALEGTECRIKECTDQARGMLGRPAVPSSDRLPTSWALIGHGRAPSVKGVAAQRIALKLRAQCPAAQGGGAEGEGRRRGNTISSAC